MSVVGIDVGRTVTDVAAVDEARGEVVVTKVPSRPEAEAAAVLAGLGIASREVRRLGHGARVALLTTQGFRDLIEIGRTKRNIPALRGPRAHAPRWPRAAPSGRGGRGARSARWPRAGPRPSPSASCARAPTPRASGASRTS